MEGETIKTPRGSAQILKRSGTRVRVKYSDTSTSWVELKDTSVAETSHAAPVNRAESTEAYPSPRVLEALPDSQVFLWEMNQYGSSGFASYEGFIYRFECDHGAGKGMSHRTYARCVHCSLFASIIPHYSTADASSPDRSGTRPRSSSSRYHPSYIEARQRQRAISKAGSSRLLQRRSRVCLAQQIRKAPCIYSPKRLCPQSEIIYILLCVC